MISEKLQIVAHVTQLTQKPKLNDFVRNKC